MNEMHPRRSFPPAPGRHTPPGRWCPSGLLVLALAALAACSQAPEADLVIRDATVVDGTGAADFRGSVAILDDEIVAIIRGDEAPPSAVETVDGTDLVLAPGFIDTHSHHDAGLQDEPGAFAAVSQGITTIVAGQDGGSRLPLTELFEELEAAPVAVNVASYSGHNTIRGRVLGDDYARPATVEELARMKALLQTDLEAGALGLATGLEYDPGIYSSREEVLELARVAAAVGGRYISHMRSEDRALSEALEELLAIGREAKLPVQISHFKLAAKSLWGTAPDVVARLERARAEGIDVTADIYPYSYWQSTMTVLFPERVYDRAAAQFALDELAPPEGIQLTAFAPGPELVGRTLAEIAQERGEDPVTTYLDLIRTSQAYRAQADEGETVEMILATSMAQEDIDTLLRWPHTNVCTDGGLQDGHPRGIGSYPRILGRYVRERGVLTLEQAIHKSTQLAAQHVGLEGRGTIEAGAPADLVLFDPETVLDQATPAEPQAPNVGIVGVWVNGERVLEGGKATGARPGRVLRRASP